MTKDVTDHALVVGVPAKQVGWMSEFGERLNLPVVSSDKDLVSRCAATGDLYILSINRVKKEENHI